MHWFVRVGDGENFRGSIKHKLWALKSWASDGKNFLSNAKDGDSLWFLTNWKGGRKLIGVATFIETKKRELGPLINVTRTNEELEWTNGSWDVEIHFKDLYLIDKLNMSPDVGFQSSLLRVKSTKCTIDFDLEYANIVKYSQVEKI
jgi:hypothetical protein